MQVVDLRRERPGDRPDLEVWASTAAELTAICALLEHGDDDSFDVGAERVAAIRELLPDAVVTRISDGTDHIWKSVTRLVGLLEPPGEAAQLFALLESDSTLAWRTLLDEVCDGGLDDEALARHASGEDDGALVDRLTAELDGWRAALVRELTAIAPSDFGEWLMEVLGPVHAAVADTLLREAMGPIEREVAARRAQLDDGADVDDVLVEATNGYELGSDIPVDRILLTPSYWFRPWLLIGRCDRTEVITSPVADEHLVLPSQAPPPALVKLCKALGDEGRLRLLRRMTGGPIQLADAMDELDVAKTTAHHHLAILRTAGLVVVRGEGRGTTYALRSDPSATTLDMLAEYLGPAATTAALRASS